MKGFLIALQFLTKVPAPKMDVSSEEFAKSFRWFPAVGIVVGLMVSGAGWLGSLIQPSLAAALGLACWVWVTGALHLDGLGDVADAAGASHKGVSSDKIRKVLADPHLGSFGVVAIVTQLILKFVLLEAFFAKDLLIPLVFIPFCARIGPLVWAKYLLPLHDGLGSTFQKQTTWPVLCIWAALWFGSVFCVWGLVAAPLFIALWGVWVTRVMGGLSGDSHGAGIEWLETGLLAAVLIGYHL